MKRAAPVFVDTSYFVALLNRKDDHHQEAVALAGRWHRLATKLVTTDAVLIETHNWFARSPARSSATRALAALRKEGGWTIVHASEDLIARGERRYARHGDKTWSLTDCISMEAAADAGAKEVATTDAHFEQAGFVVLLPGSK